MSVEPGERLMDPRIERSRLVIRRAALLELGEVGYGALTIESVARRAGVAKSTIYRHWSGKTALIADALEALNPQPGPDSEGGSPRDRVERLVRHFAEAIVDPTLSGCVPALIDAAERDPELRRLHHSYSARRLQTLVDVVADGVASGAFRTDLDPGLASLALIGPILYRRLMTNEPFDPDRIPELIDSILS